MPASTGEGRKPIMRLECVEQETGPAPAWTVLWLHGLGADGHDFAPIVPELLRPHWPALRFVFPHAPVRPVTINGGMRMRAWYDITGMDFATRADAGGIEESVAQVEALVAHEAARGIAPSRIVLAGFSQGCAMALHTGLRYPARLAALIGLSGYLPLADTLAAERSSANADAPIFLGHGTQDEMIPLPRAAASRDALAALGYAAEWHQYPMGHSVCAPEVQDVQRWLLRVLDPALDSK